MGLARFCYYTELRCALGFLFLSPIHRTVFLFIVKDNVLNLILMDLVG